MDGIEKLASLEWNKTPFIGPEGCYIEGFRAGYVAALRRAEEIAKGHAGVWRFGSKPLPNRRHRAEACEEIADAIASLLPKEPGDGEGAGG